MHISVPIVRFCDADFTLNSITMVRFCVVDFTFHLFIINSSINVIKTSEALVGAHSEGKVAVDLCNRRNDKS